MANKPSTKLIIARIIGIPIFIAGVIFLPFNTKIGWITGGIAVLVAKRKGWIGK